MAIIPFGEAYAVLGGLNLAAKDDVSGVEWIMNTLDGWGGAPNPTFNPQQRTRAPGAWAGDSFSGPRHIAASGTVWAPTSAALLQARAALKSAVGYSNTLLTVTEGGQSKWAYVRRSDAILWKPINTLTAEWSIQVVATDPRLFGTALVGATGLPLSSGGLTIPFTVPFTISSTVASGQVNLTNPGGVAGPVRMRVDGPCTGPVITHIGSASALVFSSSLVLGAGEWLDIDMEAHTVLANGQSSRAGYVTSRGWSSFDPGANTWSFTAASYNAASLLTVTAIPADE